MIALLLTEKVSATVDNCDRELVGKFKWTLTPEGYVCRSMKVATNKRKNILLHRVLLNAPKGKHVDHIDGDKLNNRRSNLRLCNSSQNQANRKISKNNTSGYKGVTWRKDRQLWAAMIMLNRKNIYLGLFTNKKEAALAYNNAAKIHYKEFALLNKI